MVGEHKRGNGEVAFDVFTTQVLAHIFPRAFKQPQYALLRRVAVSGEQRVLFREVRLNAALSLNLR